MSLNRIRHQAISTSYGNALWAASYGSEVLGWAITIGPFRQTSGADVGSVNPLPFFDTRDAVEVRVEQDCDGRFTNFAHIPNLPCWLANVLWDDDSDADEIVPFMEHMREWDWFSLDGNRVVGFGPGGMR